MIEWDRNENEVVEEEEEEEAVAADNPIDERILQAH